MQGSILSTTRAARPFTLASRVLRRAGWQLVVSATLALLFLVLEYDTRLDDSVTRLFYSPSLHGFPLRDSVWLEWLNHRLAKYAVAACGLWLLASGLYRRDSRRTFTAGMMMLGAAAVSALKARSAHSCPWDVAAYGGNAEHFPTLATIPLNAGPGHCFPGGHASAGFALVALYFYWQPAHPARARMALWGGVLAGMLMGLGQIARGAHFLSHNLWSGWVVWVVWVVCALGFALFDYRAARRHQA
jgi:membrane-associated PAP2 superfamily phosphatase